MKEKRAIFCLGDLNVDVLLAIDSYPEVGGDRRSDKMTLEIGGSVTNSAVLLRKLGNQTALLACRGDDLFGQYAQRGLEAIDLDLEYLQTAVGETTGLMFIPVTPSGQRTLFGSRGANLNLQEDQLPTSLEEGTALLISGYALLDSDQAHASRRALEMALEANLFLAMDSAYEPPLVEPEAFTPYLKHMDLLTIGEAEAKSLAGMEDLTGSIHYLLDEGVSTIALKRGSAGSRLYTAAEEWDLPTLAVQPVDTTGAGDNFTAGLLHGILVGLALPAAGLLASAAASHIINRWGAGLQAGAPADLLAVLEGSRKAVSSELAPHCQAAIDHLGSITETSS